MMAMTWHNVSDWFWCSDIWLPPGYVWADVVPNEKVNYTNWNDLWTYPFVMAFIFIFLRFVVLDTLVYGPIARYFGLRDNKPRPVLPNAILEQLFKKCKNKQSESDISQCATRLQWSERRVERWLRQRASVNRVSRYRKFLECAWQFTYYTAIFFFGMYVLRGKSWVWDILNCYRDYPNHNVDSDIWWYYMLSLSFYWCMTFTHFFETKRKDFWQMFIHHLVTIILIVLSWTCNLTRAGSLVLILHDCADIPLQVTKLTVYTGHKALCDAVFAFFALLWIITRIGIYPFWIINSTLIEAPKIVPMFFAYYIFNGLLLSLLILHVYWTYLILKIIANTFTRGRVEDARSSSDELSDELDLSDGKKDS